METEGSAALAAANAADVLIQMKYSDWPTVGTELSREMTIDDNVSTATAAPLDMAETQAGSETEESDEGASVQTLCGPEPAEVVEAPFGAKSEAYVLESLGRSFELTR